MVTGNSYRDIINPVAPLFQAHSIRWGQSLFIAADIKSMNKMELLPPPPPTPSPLLEACNTVNGSENKKINSEIESYAAEGMPPPPKRIRIFMSLRFSI